jgi:signal transduction histidine kinase
LDKKILLIILRYLAISFSLAASILMMKAGVNVNIYFISFYLIFIINNQLRFFSLSKRFIFYALSLILEFALAFIIFYSFGGILFLLLFCILMDVSMNISNKYIRLCFQFLIITVILMNGQVADGQTLSNILSIIAVGGLSSFIKDETEKKLEAQKLYDKLRISEEELKAAKEEVERYASTVEELTLLRERNRISREIHDSVGHSLSTMIIQLSAIEKIAEKDGKAAVEMAAGLSKFAKEALRDVRAAVRALKPIEFEKYQGILAIEEMIKNFRKLTEIEVIFALSRDIWELDSDKSFILYRVIQELLTNSVKHGKASKVNINLNFFQDSLYMRLKDNGIGCNNVVEGVGLKSIKERVQGGSGTVKYTSEQGRGFEFILTLPKVEALIKEL